jgi:hypothetical protein
MRKISAAAIVLIALALTLTLLGSFWFSTDTSVSIDSQTG